MTTRLWLVRRLSLQGGRIPRQPEGVGPWPVESPPDSRERGSHLRGSASGADRQGGIDWPFLNSARVWAFCRQPDSVPY
jgi:hypothetical protein